MPARRQTEGGQQGRGRGQPLQDLPNRRACSCRGFPEAARPHGEPEGVQGETRGRSELVAKREEGAGRIAGGTGGVRRGEAHGPPAGGGLLARQGPCPKRQGGLLTATGPPQAEAQPGPGRRGGGLSTEVGPSLASGRGQKGTEPHQGGPPRRQPPLRRGATPQKAGRQERPRHPAPPQAEEGAKRDEDPGTAAGRDPARERAATTTSTAPVERAGAAATCEKKCEMRASEGNPEIPTGKKETSGALSKIGEKVLRARTEVRCKVGGRHLRSYLRMTMSNSNVTILVGENETTAMLLF
ncbi:hypothetical protein QBC46DRAFT_400362 [Diplogelasinospora grovesii]|uniref:Uncharacterized protein n=1 Tax=Diplogelasinospora grovesii TaxID=303347 RepID=A0AAN6MWN0_9PEZI|nr:hypothetical protein QBC46DRAFT_400362 [Diplogelasinospora grovesii]